MKISYVDIAQQYATHREEILGAIDTVLASGDYILGAEVEKFEKQFASLCGVKHAIGVADGTAALSLTMRALKIGSGDEVITAPNSFFASASSIVHVGATPVFCDVRADQNIDPELLEKSITKKTKAIIPVHLTGKVAEMNAILEIAKKYNLHVIEDAAQSVNATYFGRKSGSMGIAGCFSLHPLKNLNAAGDAGVITTNDDQLASSLRLMRNHGMVNRDTITSWGYNSRLDEIQAAILNVRIKYIEDVTAKRKKNAALYRSILGNVVHTPNDQANASDVYHLFVIQCDRRDELKNYLKEKGVSTSIHYPNPIHLLDASRTLGYKAGDFPRTEEQAKRILSLPVHQELTEDQIRYCAERIIKFYN